MPELHHDPVINQLMVELQKIQNPAPVAPEPIVVKKLDPVEEARIRIDSFEKERAWHMLRGPLNGLIDGKLKDYLADLRVVLHRIENNLSYKDMTSLVTLLENFKASDHRIRVTYSSSPKWALGWSIWSTATIKNGKASFFQEAVGTLVNPRTGRCISYNDTSMEYPGYLPEIEALEATRIAFYPTNLASIALLEDARNHMEIEESVPTRNIKRIHTPERSDYYTPCSTTWAPTQAVPGEITKIIGQAGSGLAFKCGKEPIIIGGKEPFHVKVRILRTNKFEGLSLLCIIQGKYLRKED